MTRGIAASVLIVLLLGGSILHAQVHWKPVNSLLGGAFDCVVTMDSNVFAFSDLGDVFRTSEGIRWTRTGRVVDYKGHGLQWSGHIRSSLLVSSDSNTYLSSDRGVTWVNLLVSKTQSGRLGGCNDSCIFLINPSGLYRSKDTGTSWTSIYPPRRAVTSCATPSALFVIDSSSDGTGGIYRSTDNGNSWTHLDTTFARRRVHLFNDVNNLYVIADKLYYSDNNGASWSVRSVDQWSFPYVISSTRFGVFIESYGEGPGLITRTTDSGSHWTSQYDSIFYYTQLWNTVDLNGILFLATSAGIYNSYDTGLSWSRCLVGIDTIPPVDLEYADGTLIATSESGVFISHDDGGTWESPPNLVSAQISDIARHGRSWLLTSWEGYFTDAEIVFQSTDHGHSWDSVSLIGMGSMYANSKGMILIGYFGGLYRLDDSSSVWLDSGFYISDNIRNVALNDSLFVVYRDSEHVQQLVLSNDFGSTWGHISIPDSDLYTLVVDGTIIYAGSQKGLYRSWDQGESWSLVDDHWSFYTLKSAGPILISWDSKGIVLSTNYGDSWTAINLGLSNLDVSSVAIDDSLLFAALKSGAIYKAAIPTFSSVSLRKSEQDLVCYPNPALNSITLMRGDVSISTVRIFDALGREVPHYSVPNFAGEITLDIHTLPTGVYTAQLNGVDSEQIARFLKQ